MVILSSLLIIFFSIVFILFLILFRYRYLINHNNYLIHKHILDNVCDIYKKSMYLPQLEKLKHSYNLDSESQLNAIKAFSRAEQDLLKKSSLEVYKLLTKQNLLFLKTYYSEQSLLFIIINNLRA